MTQRVVNYTYGTGNPVLPDGSIDVRDGIDNLQSFDIFMNADEDTYNQRDGGVVKTRAGAVRAVGIQRIGDFTAGCTVTERNQGVLYETDGTVYVWLGALPKVVPPASSPATTGGVSPSGWLDIGDASAYSRIKIDLADKSGSTIIGEVSTAIELQALNAIEFSRVRTLGYYTNGDDGGAEYEVSSTFGFGGLTLPNGLFANPVNLTSPRQIGWTTTGGQANYDLMAAFVNAGKASPGRYKTLLTLHRIYAEWLAGRGCPIAFYGDSTTDGATTTGHAASVANGLTWSSTVTINASPNSYPNVLKTWCAKNAPAAKIYNAGFDSTSLRDDTGSYGDEFGNKFFHRVFFGYPTYNNVDFRDVKAIALSWGTSDSINLNDVNTIISSYEWKMELLIVECFERGIQPIINHPVLNTQRRGSLVNGRDNDESISIVQSINERLAKKYNLEVISLHDALYNYVNDNDGRDGDYLKVLAVDGVHPNDMGHRQIAGWMYSRINPLVKTVSHGEKFVVSACSPYEYTVPALNGTSIWLAYDRTQLISDQSYFHRFTPASAGEFFIRFYVYCEQPCDLSYSGLMDNNSIVTDFNKVPKVSVKNVASDITRVSELWSDYQAVYTTLTTTSSQLLGRLEVGLNEVEVVAPSVLGLRASFDFGAFIIKPRSRRGVTKEFLSGSGNNVFRAEVSSLFGEIMYLSSAVSGVIWCDAKFEDSSYYTGRVGTENTITFKASYLKNRSVYWAANRRYKEFDSYNKLSISGTTVVLSVVFPNSSGTPVENIIATMTSSYDFTAISPYETISIVVSNKADGSIEFYLRKLNKTTAVFDVLCSTTMAAASTSRIFQHGYSFGASKSVVDGIYMHITDIIINSNV